MLLYSLWFQLIFDRLSRHYLVVYNTEIFSLVKDVTQKSSLLKSDQKRKTSTYFSPMNLDDDEFDDLCKGFQIQSLNGKDENSMEIDEEVKLDEIPQVLGEVNEENVSGKAEKVKEATYWCTYLTGWFIRGINIYI